jgi:flagellar basal-body rod protein FlgB
MIDGLFQSSAIPMMQEVANFAQLRHTVLAGNIANLDTPGYKFRDLSVDDFQATLKEAIEARDKPADPYRPGKYDQHNDPFKAVMASKPHTILRHDKSNVELEQQVAEMTKNYMQHNLALTIMRQQFSLLGMAISERL